MVLPRLLGLAERAWVGNPSWGDIEDLAQLRSERDAAWNEFANRIGQYELDRLDKIFKDIKNNSHMYFVHSYEFVPVDKNVILATTDYSSNIVSAVEKENIFGTQFHPEKSDKIGLKTIDNFMNL